MQGQGIAGVPAGGLVDSTGGPLRLLLPRLVGGELSMLHLP